MQILSILFGITLIFCILMLVGGAVLFALSKRHTTAYILGISIGIIGMLGTIFSIIGLSASGITADSWEGRIPSAIEIIPDTTPSDSPQPDQDGWYPAGSYRVGVDIPADEYCLLARNEYATASVSDTDQTDYSRIAFFSTHRFVTVEDGEYLIVEEADFIPADQLTPFSAQPDGSYTAGEYRVGIDIPEGEYYLYADGSSPLVELYDENSLDYNDIERNIAFDTFSFIEVENGEYLVLEHAAAIDVKNAPKPTPDTDGFYQAGTYRVGIDIPEGIYYVRSTAESCYYEVCEDSRDDCEYNDYFETFTYVTLEQDDYFYLQHGAFISEQDAPRAFPDGDRYGPGVYRIGIDIPAGKYHITANKLTDAASAGITDEMQGSRTDYDEYEYFYGSTTVTVENGDYLEVRGASFAAE